VQVAYQISSQHPPLLVIMVRVTVAFVVLSLGAAAVIAQVPESSSQLEARDLENDLEVREYVVDDLEAREPEDFFEEVVAREPEFFDDIEAREFETEELEARAPAPANPSPSSAPSKTVTVTATPTPTSCTTKELKSQKQQQKVQQALAIVKAAKGKTNLTADEKAQVKKARKYLRRVRSRRSKSAKRVVKKCRKALRKASLTPQQCASGGAQCDSALSAKKLTLEKCQAARQYLKAAKSAKSSKKSRKSKSSKSKKSTSSSKSRVSKKSGRRSASKTTVGSDGVTTVTVNAGPTCTPTAGSGSKSKLRKREFDTLFSREYDYDNLD